jgi:hypothetical protein
VYTQTCTHNTYDDEELCAKEVWLRRKVVNDHRNIVRLIAFLAATPSIAHIAGLRGERVEFLSRGEHAGRHKGVP